jgi:hypothetical protein
MKSTMKHRILRALSSTGFSARVLVAIALAGVITSACDVHGVVAPGTLTSITVTPNATLVTGTTQQMVAVGHDAEGRDIAISPNWSAASGGGITAAGVFTAGNVPGFFSKTVVATVGGVSGSADITVTPGVLATISILPTPVTLAVTATQQFVAVGKDAAGNIVGMTPTWSMLGSPVPGTIDQTGKFIAGAAIGTYLSSVQASSAGIKGLADVIVTAGPLASITIKPNPDTLIVGAKQQFVATGKDASGNTVQIAAAWSVVAGGGTIDQAGLFTAGPTPGTFPSTIKATSGTLSNTATVVVTAGTLATITVTPNPWTMAINETKQFKAVGYDIAGNQIVITPAWDVVALGGKIDTTGTFTAGVVSGTFTKTIRATDKSSGLTGFATVIVTTGPLATITVTPDPVFMPTNSTQQYVAVGKDANGNVFVLNGQTLIWSVVNQGGLIDNTGLFTSGTTAGTFLNTIVAASGAISSTGATVTVNAPPPPPPPDILGAAAPNGIMAGASVTCSGTGVISADIAVSPGSTISGFPPCTRSGSLHLGDATALAEQNALTAAYNTLFGKTCPAANNFGTVDYASKTLPAGVYCSPSTINVTGTLTLDGGGDPNAIFVFQAGSALIGAANIVLIRNAQAKNVYWVVGSSATLNASAWQGNIVALTSISLNVNSTMLGRALARNGSVSLDASHNVITLP